jgi:hypothetical protein
MLLSHKKPPTTPTTMSGHPPAERAFMLKAVRVAIAEKQTELLVLAHAAEYLEQQMMREARDEEKAEQRRQAALQRGEDRARLHAEQADGRRKI